MVVEKRVLQILDASPFFWTSDERLLKGIHPNIGRRTLSDLLREMVKQGTVRKLERHSAPPFFRITDAGRAALTPEPNPHD